MNAPWWRLSTEPAQSKQSETVTVERTDDSSDLLPPFYD